MIDAHTTYLSLFDLDVQEITSSKDYLSQTNLFLGEIKTVRSRSVYNFIDLVAEVSGIADMFIVFTTFFISLFYTSFAQEAFTVHNLILFM